MLGNNEQIQGVSLAEVFGQMLGELPWSNLMAYIQSNSPLQKMCTIGGHRLVPDKRKRFEQIICREAEKQAYIETVTNGVFAAWYPVHTELHSKLEDYFHSEDYKKYREEKSLQEDEYVLSDEKLNEFYDVNDIRLWKILLCFSPLKFTAEQAQKLLDNTDGNEELVEKIKNLEAANVELSRKSEALTAESAKLRDKQNEDGKELLELKKQLRQQKQDLELNQKKLESAQAENRRLAQLIQDADSQRSDAEASLRNESQRSENRLKAELERLNKEILAWQQRYEEQRVANKDLEAGMVQAKKSQTDMEVRLAAAETKLAEGLDIADVILERIDWARVGVALKLTPTMRRNFNSLIKKLNYEEDRTLTIEGTLEQFWQKLAAPEQALVKAIVNSNVDEVATGVIKDYWEGLMERFNEVQVNLEARMVLLGLLQDIFYQTIEMDDLKDAILSKTKTKTKKKTEDK